MEFFVFAILLTATVAKQSQLEGPQNTLSVLGSTVTFKCLSPSRNCVGIDWQKYVPGTNNPTMTVFKGPRTMLNVVDRNRYSVDNSSGCDLIIRNVQLKDAGRFICSAIISSSQTTKSANLIILDKLSTCTTNGSQDNTAEGDIVRMTCEVTYNGTNRASMNWTGVTDAPDTVKNGTTISRSFIVDASAPEVPSFTCEASFACETPDNGVPIAGLATNIPVTSCETSVIKVMYSVRNVTLSPSISRNSSGNAIVCSAKGYPLPTYKWQAMENGSSWADFQNQTGCKFTAPSVSSKMYRCIAMNVVRGKSYSAASHEILDNNTETDFVSDSQIITRGFADFTLQPLSDHTATPMNHFPIIHVAVGGAVGFLLLIILLVTCCCVTVCPGYRCCHSEDKTDDAVTSANSRLNLLAFRSEPNSEKVYV